jgi:hypothetical protein
MSHLRDVNVGDKVIIPGGPYSPGRVVVVEKTTKTQFTADGIRWLKDCGSKVGSSRSAWQKCRAYVATPELIEVCENYQTLSRLARECDRHLSAIQGQVTAAVRAKKKEDQLRFIESLGKVVDALKTVSPPPEQ